MKRKHFAAIVACIIFALALAGCGGASQASSSSPEESYADAQFVQDLGKALEARWAITDAPANESLTQRLGGCPPVVLPLPLGLGGECVQQVQTKHQLCLGQQLHLLSFDADEVAHRLGLVARRVALRQAEELFGLQRVGS